MTTEQVLHNEITRSNISIKVNGSNLSPELYGLILETTVEQSLYVPGAFSIKFLNTEMKASNNTVLTLGAEVEIGMGQTTAASLMKGEITSFEMEVDHTFREFYMVRGYDKLHRLQRGRYSKTWLDATDSDAISAVVREAGLSADIINLTPTRKYILQNNETNYEFVQRLARQHDKELVFLAGKCTLRTKPAATGGGFALAYGTNLLRMKAYRNTHYEVSEVKVYGYNPVAKNTNTGVSSGGVVNSNFGTPKLHTVYSYVENQSEADKLATSIHNQLKGRSLQIDGVAIGDPAIKAGSLVDVQKVGTEFSKNYYVSSTRHHFGADGYTTAFVGSGNDLNSLYELTGHNQSEIEQRNTPLVVGIVSDNKDPDNKGKIKVKFPTMKSDNAGDIESTWARLVTPMAGNGRGMFFIPEVNDEVLVGFEMGNVDRPYIVGSVWNGVDAPPMSQGSMVGNDGKVNIRHFQTRAGHKLTFTDTDGSEAITILDKTGKNKIEITSADNKITITSDKDIDMLATKGKINIDAKEIVINGTDSVKTTSKAITSTAQQDFAMESSSANLTLKATQNVKINSTINTEINATVKLDMKGTAQANLAGAIVSVKADGVGTVEAGGMLNVKGSILKLN